MSKQIKQWTGGKSGYRYETVQIAPNQVVGRVWDKDHKVYQSPVHDDDFAASIDLDVWRDAHGEDD